MATWGLSYLICYLFSVRTHFAWRVRATTPAARGAAALVPVKSSLHPPFKLVVVCVRVEGGRTYIIVTVVNVYLRIIHLQNSFIYNNINFYHLSVSLPRVSGWWISVWIVSKSHGHLWGTLLIKGSLSPVLVSCTNRDGVDTGREAISGAGIEITTTITSCPDIDSTLAMATLQWSTNQIIEMCMIIFTCR